MDVMKGGGSGRLFLKVSHHSRGSGECKPGNVEVEAQEGRISVLSAYERGHNAIEVFCTQNTLESVELSRRNFVNQKFISSGRGISSIVGGEIRWSHRLEFARSTAELESFTSVQFVQAITLQLV